MRSGLTRQASRRCGGGRIGLQYVVIENGQTGGHIYVPCNLSIGTYVVNAVIYRTIRRQFRCVVKFLCASKVGDLPKVVS